MSFDHQITINDIYTRHAFLVQAALRQRCRQRGHEIRTCIIGIRVSKLALQCASERIEESNETARTVASLHHNNTVRQAVQIAIHRCHTQKRLKTRRLRRSKGEKRFERRPAQSVKHLDLRAVEIAGTDDNVGDCVAVDASHVDRHAAAEGIIERQEGSYLSGGWAAIPNDHG